MEVCSSKLNVNWGVCVRVCVCVSMFGGLGKGKEIQGN